MKKIGSLWPSKKFLYTLYKCFWLNGPLSDTYNDTLMTDRAFIYMYSVCLNKTVSEFGVIVAWTAVLLLVINSLQYYDIVAQSAKCLVIVEYIHRDT